MYLDDLNSSAKISEVNMAGSFMPKKYLGGAEDAIDVECFPDAGGPGFGPLQGTKTRCDFTGLETPSGEAETRPAGVQGHQGLHRSSRPAWAM